MRNILLLLLLPALCSAQLQTFKAPTTQWGHEVNAALYVPEGAGKFPTILFFHGKGESGTNANTFTGSYLLKRIRGGWKPQAVNPTTGITEYFIVIAIQDPSWSPYPASMQYALNYIVKKYNLPIDSNRIYTTGLSAGGQTSLMWASWDSTSYRNVAAVVSASPAVIEQRALNNLPQLGKYGVPVYFWSGAQDGHFTENATRYAKVIVDNGGKAGVQTYPGGHCCWDDLFSGKEKLRWEAKEYDMYQWLLLHSKIAVPPVQEPPVPPIDTVKYIQILHDPAKVFKIIVIDKDGTVTSIDSTSTTSGELKISTQ